MKKKLRFVSIGLILLLGVTAFFYLKRPKVKFTRAKLVYGEEYGQDIYTT
ncbi:MAG: hypothetical protein N4A57_03455 [Anaeromicrobium sp.]|jgi:hypothetical protein|nr:hypothetical protein [Anaeromicrobium sp.]MCT4593317.1 hypothetical protein [Anaeromicrobium sp.]